MTGRHFSCQLPFGRTASQGSSLRASPDMVSSPPVVTGAPAEPLPGRADAERPPAVGRAGCGGGGGGGLGRGPALGSRVLQEFPSPDEALRRKKNTQNFSLVTPPGITVRNSLPALAGSSSVQGNPENQLRAGEGAEGAAAASARAPGAPRSPGVGGGARRRGHERGGALGPRPR